VRRCSLLRLRQACNFLRRSQSLRNCNFGLGALKIQYELVSTVVKSTISVEWKIELSKLLNRSARVNCLFLLGYVRRLPYIGQTPYVTLELPGSRGKRQTIKGGLGCH
jgi:hypothetical protein